VPIRYTLGVQYDTTTQRSEPESVHSRTGQTSVFFRTPRDRVSATIVRTKAVPRLQSERRPQRGAVKGLHVLLASTQLQVATRERARLGRELHDGIVQELIALDMQLEVLLRDHARSPQELVGTIRQVQSRLRAGTVHLRHIIEGSRESEVTPAQLPEAIDEVVWRFRRETQIAVTYAVHLEGVALRLPPRVCSELVSVVREALINVARHSGAANVAVEFTSDARHFKLTIADDGCGFAVNRPPSVMRERLHSIGGRVQVAPLTHGSRLEISIPREGPWKESVLSESSWRTIIQFFVTG
jgi:signal transduction histidine kinase